MYNLLDANLVCGFNLNANYKWDVDLNYYYFSFIEPNKVVNFIINGCSNQIREKEHDKAIEL